MNEAQPKVGVLMGSASDWPVLQHAAAILAEFGVPHECKVVSAHRMPDEMFDYAAGARGRGLMAIIAGAGGAAHLPGMLAAKTTLPVLGVPMPSKHLNGMDSLLSTVQMPKGIPVATFAIGDAGAANAALFAVAMLAGEDPALRAKLEAFRAEQTETARSMTLPPLRTNTWATNTSSRRSSICTRTTSPPRRLSTSSSRSWVSGRAGTTPCCAKAMAVASTAPIQMGR